jgi:outer membrane protein OmpA-like peptidoglycan-associated protein
VRVFAGRMLGLLAMLLCTAALGDRPSIAVVVTNYEPSIRLRPIRQPTVVMYDEEVPGEVQTFPFSEVVYFDFNSCIVESDQQEKVAAAVALLDGADSTAEVSGHTDERGTTDVNWRYGQCRADAVSRLLAGFLPGLRAQATSFGEEDLVVLDAETEEEHALNRRVTIDFVASIVTEPQLVTRTVITQPRYQRKDYLGLWH